MAARLHGLPVAVHVGAPRDFSPSRTRLWVHRFIRPAYVGTSEFIVNGIREHVSYLADARVAAIHPGTPMPIAPPLPSRRPYTLITTSQLTLPKRHQDLIRACGQLKREGMDFRLRIVGTGDQEQTLRALTVMCDLEDRVVFRGFVSDVGEELRQADIFVLPTDAEPLGIALEEAMAHGLFPLARNSGGGYRKYGRTASARTFYPPRRDPKNSPRGCAPCSPWNLPCWTNGGGPYRPTPGLPSARKRSLKNSRPFWKVADRRDFVFSAGKKTDLFPGEIRFC